MTSKSPVRSCEDVDATALSYAEIKMLAADNPHIKEKMDLDIQVQKLRLLKSNYLSEKYELEDKIIKYYPTTIARTKETIAGLEKDISLAKEHPKPLDDTFVGIEVKGVSYSEKAEGGQKIIDACKEMTSPDPIPLGKYRGFDLELSFDTFEKAYQVKIKGARAFRRQSRISSRQRTVFRNSRKSGRRSRFKNRHRRQLHEKASVRVSNRWNSRRRQ
ncbi:hypothetical protein GPK69_00205 [Roseburia inulinivorans]|nr:hypothetical protein [Roseburia inulinivorans]